MPLFILSTHKQCILSHFIRYNTAMFVLETLYPGGIRTRVFVFLRLMRCPLRHSYSGLSLWFFAKSQAGFKQCGQIGRYLTFCEKLPQKLFSKERNFKPFLSYFKYTNTQKSN
jgi:hypothetical protein